MYSGPPKSAVDLYKTVAQKLLDSLDSKIEVTVSSVTGSEKKPLKQVFEEAKRAGKALIFTFTPGPFKDAKEVTDQWKATDAACGCTPQLNAFEANFAKLNAVVIAVNKQSSVYQAGTKGTEGTEGTEGVEGLLAVKKYHHLLMISDADGSLEKALGLPTITVNEKKYLSRFTIVFNANQQFEVFEISSPVTPAKAELHISQISQFLSPAPQAQPVAEAARMTAGQ